MIQMNRFAGLNWYTDVHKQRMATKGGKWGCGSRCVKNLEIGIDIYIYTNMYKMDN